MAASVTRFDRRRSYEIPARLQMLEDDADSADTSLAEMNARLGRILWALIGILISTATASILLGLNLAVGR